MNKTSSTSSAPTKDFHEFEASGAKRSSLAPSYHLIPTAGHKRLAGRFNLGLKKYTKDNWRKGLEDSEFLDQVIDHMIEHLEHYKDFRRSVSWFKDNLVNHDDDLAAIAWGAYVLMEYEDLHGPK